MDFTFETDDETKPICHEIIRVMSELYGISEDEALGRMNKRWKGGSVVRSHPLYEYEPSYFAGMLYYRNWRSCYIENDFSKLEVDPYP